MLSVSAMAQVPVPVPDPGPGSPPNDTCLVCSGIEQAISVQQAALDALSCQIESLEAEIDTLEQDKLTIEGNNWPQELKVWALAWANMMIFDLERQIEALKAQQQSIQASIDGLWQSWSANDCDEADC
jgi:cell division protein FtsB